MKAQIVDCSNSVGRFEVVVDLDAHRVVRMTPQNGMTRDSDPHRGSFVWDPLCGRKMTLLERHVARTALAVAP